MWSTGKAYNNRAASFSGEKGFTLLELIVVMVLLGVFAALSAPAVGKSVSNLNLSTSARRLAAVLRYARSRAIADKETRRVAFFPEEGEYFFPSASGDKKINLPTGVLIQEIKPGNEIPDEGATVIFYPKGNSNGCRVILSNEREHSYLIKVERISGRVKILTPEEYE